MKLNSTSKGKAKAKEVRVMFKLKHAQTLMGEYISVVGGDDALGNWENQIGHHLSTNAVDYPQWSSGKILKFNIESLEQSKKIKYKYLIQNDHFRVRWENGVIRTIDLSKFYLGENPGQVVVIEDEAYGNEINMFTKPHIFLMSVCQ